MIRKLLATTALATLVVTAAYAQQDPAAPAPGTEATQPAAPSTDATQPVVKADGFLATNMIGESVYNGTGDNADNIGDVNDIVIGAKGDVQAIVVGVGGFLGIGEKNVAIEFANLQWAEANGDRWLVTAATKEQLEALPTFDRAPYDPTPAPVASSDPAMAPATDTTAQAPATEAPATDMTAEAPATDPAAPATTEQPAVDQQAAEAPAATDQPAATDPGTTAAIDKTTLTEIPAGDLKTEELTGTTVYGANDENVGEISDIVLTADGKVDAVIIDVGGFLGMGEKPVAIGFEKLVFMTDKDGKKYLYTTFTKEQLEAHPAYDKSTYAEKRDEQRLMVQ